MSRVVVGWALGAALSTILWFTLSPLLTDEQQDLVGWLLVGSYVVFSAVMLHRARRRADHSRSS